MSFTIVPGKAGKITFHVRYDGTAVPKDLQIYLLDPQNPDLAHAKKIIGYPEIPPDLDPKKGIDIPYYPGAQFPTENGRLAPGIYTFLLEWSFGGTQPNEPDTDKPSITGEPREPESGKPWSLEQLLAKIAAGAGGSAVSGALLNWWTVVAFLPCVITGAIGGAVGGILGYLFNQWFDAPKIRWNFRSSFLFTLLFTILFSLLFGLLAIGPEREAAARGETWNRVTLGVSAISGFLAGILSGVMNNLRDQS
jgi:hypothetical protein